MTKQEAKALQDVVNTILQLAFEQRKQHPLCNAAVNWADLGCTDVEARTSLLSGSTMVAVTIEEASPEATQLIKFISEKLEEYGYPEVYITCEW